MSIGKEQEKVSYSNKQGSGRGVKEQEMPGIAVEKEEGRYRGCGVGKAVVILYAIII